ncbi:unnamed protein product [Pleuronectes platessa]|uniref:Uncharacterized protein n=1 Tax=Pleuronectes platessa TaxID=8262 RepID=A0A9N7Y954_PLEPL|nr:unnamed protein product [Pleuronectes platessa]
MAPFSGSIRPDSTQTQRGLYVRYRATFPHKTTVTPPTLTHTESNDSSTSGNNDTPGEDTASLFTVRRMRGALSLPLMVNTDECQRSAPHNHPAERQRANTPPLASQPRIEQKRVGVANRGGGTDAAND